MFKKNIIGLGCKKKVFDVPKTFSIEINRDETLTFFESIFHYLDKFPNNINNEIIFINSREVQYVTESTLMYLFAIISDIRCTNYDVTGNHPLDEECKLMYQACGFDKALSKEKIAYNIGSLGDMVIARGNKIKPDFVKNICNFVKDKTSLKDTTELYGALIELMDNTVHHAYDMDEIRLEKKWQVFLKETNGIVKFVFLDTGKGIPATVKKNKTERFLEVFKPILKFVGEGDILKSAFEGEFRSRTEKPNRGKGLPQIYRLLKSSYIDNVFVYSGKGSCMIRESCEEYYFSNDNEFYGTLYEFNIIGV